MDRFAKLTTLFFLLKKHYLTLSQINFQHSPLTNGIKLIYKFLKVIFITCLQKYQLEIKQNNIQLLLSVIYDHLHSNIIDPSFHFSYHSIHKQLRWHYYISLPHTHVFWNLTSFFFTLTHALASIYNTFIPSTAILFHPTPYYTSITSHIYFPVYSAICLLQITECTITFLLLWLDILTYPHTEDLIYTTPPCSKSTIFLTNFILSSFVLFELGFYCTPC